MFPVHTHTHQSRVRHESAFTKWPLASNIHFDELHLATSLLLSRSLFQRTCYMVTCFISCSGYVNSSPHSTASLSLFFSFLCECVYVCLIGCKLPVQLNALFLFSPPLLSSLASSYSACFIALAHSTASITSIYPVQTLVPPELLHLRIH